MSKRIVWLVLAFVLLTAVGCAAETLPASDAPQENTPALEPTAEIVQVDTPTAAAQEEDTPTIKPAAAATVTDSATAEALKKILESELLETPTLPASVTPLLEEVLQLQPTSSKPNPEALQHIAYARSDLAQKLGLDLATIEVVAYEVAIWRDGSLGCPQPGMMYTQALVDGYLIQLRVGEQTYNYHGANGHDPFLCIDDPETTNQPPGIQSDGSLAAPPGEDK